MSLNCSTLLNKRNVALLSGPVREPSASVAERRLVHPRGPVPEFIRIALILTETGERSDLEWPPVGRLREAGIIQLTHPAVG